MTVDELRMDCAKKQKKGIHFIAASIVIWSLLLVVQLLPAPVLTKNLLTFCCTGPLVPLAWLLSKPMKIQFSDKTNPLNQLGLLFSLNQMLYLLIAMWVYAAVPHKMLMVIAMIFGAHLLPYGWLYKSKSYTVMAVVIPIVALILGCSMGNVTLAAVMIVFEAAFTGLLVLENQKR